MKKLSFLLTLSITSCTQYKTISYREAKVVDGKLVVQPEVITKKVYLGDIHWMKKSTKFSEGQTVNLIK